MPDGDRPDPRTDTALPPEERVRLACPRCGVQLRRRPMVNHLWQEHGLLLDGRRVREPWPMIEAWVEDYRRLRDTDLLDRCRFLGERLDPDHGLTRVRRLFLSRGIEDAEARQALLAEAAAKRGSLCPHCWGPVPLPAEVPLRPANVWHGRVSLHGYRVEVPDEGLLTRLEIETPAGLVYRGPEPDHQLTRKAALLLFVGPPVLVALLIAVGIVAPALPPLLPVLLLLAGALVVAVGVRLHWPTPAPPGDRALDHAWTRLAPRLHTDGFSPRDAAFASGLALASLGRGNADLRRRPLHRLMAVTEKAVAAGSAGVEHLADLRLLEIAGGADPLPSLVAEVGRCFEGKLSLAYAERLLRGWSRGARIPAERERLRLLLVDRAFEAGFEVRHLIEAGRAAPALAATLQTDQPDRLACLRLLWSWRPRRPWDVCGPSATAFDLAGDGEENPHLANYPDLLWLQEIALPPGPDEKQVLIVCARGVALRDTVFAQPPRTVEVISKRQQERRSYELVVGAARFGFRHDPNEVATRLERWCRFFFNEFLPQVPAVHGWRSPSVAASLRARETVPCPSCRRVLLPRAGQVGIALEGDSL
jgi:hypothetical protein